MTLRTVNIEALDEEHFIGVGKSDGTIKLKLKISNDQGNQLAVNNAGLHVGPTRWEDIPNKPNPVHDGGQFLTFNPNTFSQAIGVLFNGSDGTRRGLESPMNQTREWTLFKNKVNRDIHFPAIANNSSENVAYQSWVESKIQRSPDANNALQVRQNGLYVPIPMLTGPGRPDQPNTTNGIISANDSSVSGTIYISTDGAGVGAWQWTRTNNGWKIAYGDTGWRRINDNKLASGYLALRRVNDTCYFTMAGGTYDTFHFRSIDSDLPSSDSKWRYSISSVPNGYRAIHTSSALLTVDNYENVGLVIVTPINDGNVFQIRAHHVLPATSNSLLRMGQLVWTTNDEWPSSLPGIAE